MVSAGRVLSIALAVAMVTVPLWGPALSLSDPRIEYRAVELTTTNETLSVATDDPPHVGGDLPIDCFGDVRGSRGCVLDASLLDGPRTIDYPPLRSGSGNPSLARDRYVAFGFESPVYRRTADYAPNGSYRLGLERVAPATALRAVATEPQFAPPVVRRAVETGSATTDTPLSGGYIVADPDDEAADPTFYLVHRAARHRGSPVDLNPGDAAVLEGLSVLAGAWLLLGLRPPLTAE